MHFAHTQVGGKAHGLAEKRVLEETTYNSETVVFQFELVIIDYIRAQEEEAASPRRP